MKKITVILTLSFILISACMVYLIVSGISLRSASLISPSVMSPDRHSIAKGLVIRLFPDLQNARYVLWGTLPETEESQKVLGFFIEEYAQAFQAPMHILRNAETATSEELQACEKPCLLMLPTANANELSTNEFIEKKIRPLTRDYFNITWVPFYNIELVPDICEQQKRLSMDCLIPLSVRDVKKKIKDPNQLYFFLRKYNDRDYFLFVQQPKAK
jgi:hypothetical protein